MARMAEKLPLATRLGPLAALMEARFSPDRWIVGVLLVTFVLLLGASEWLVARVNVTGDEPWYLLQSYGLIHLHSSNLTPLLRDPAIYARFLGTHVDSHTRDYAGHGERVLFYLPGYAAIIAPFYALGGRPLIVAFQSLVGALTGALVFVEARRLFGSRVVAIFAWLTYLCTLPVLLYAGQIFPSTLATCALVLGYLLVTRWLPAAKGNGIIGVSVAVGLLVFMLPWLHFKYALPTLVLAGGALDVLRPQLHWPPASATQRQAWRGAALVAGLTTLCFAMIVLYSRHYFGSWMPPSATTSPDLLHPHPERIPGLYSEIFLSQERGLLPWVPLDLLALPGLALLLRLQPRPARFALALLGALLITFVSTTVTPVYQGYAFPGRFTLECAPFFALATAALVATGEQALRGWLVARAEWLRRWWRDTTPTAGRPSGVPSNAPERAAPGDSRSGSRRSSATVWTQRLGALLALALLSATGWFAAIGESDPLLLYPSFAGVRLAAAHPNLLPGTWFALFPHEPQSYVPRRTVMYAPSRSAGAATRTADGTTGFLGQPASLPAGSLLAQTNPEDLPSDRYVATFALACDRGSAGDVAFRLVIVRALDEQNLRATTLVRQTVGTQACLGLSQSIHLRVPFASNGYSALTFRVEYGGAVPVIAWSVAYAPAG